MAIGHPLPVVTSHAAGGVTSHSTPHTLAGGSYRFWPRDVTPRRRCGGPVEQPGDAAAAAAAVVDSTDTRHRLRLASK